MPKFYHKILPKHTQLYLYLRSVWLLHVKGMRTKIKKQIQETLSQNKPLQVDMGAGPIRYENWIATDQPAHDMANPKHWAILFQEGSIDRLMVEDSFAHITYFKVEKAISLASKYVKKGGTFRIAVPDGFSTDTEYVKSMKPQGGKNYDNHHSMWDVYSLSKILQRHGFEPTPVEYHLPDGSFHFSDPLDETNGNIIRAFCKKHKDLSIASDKFYTSLIIDSIKT